MELTVENTGANMARYSALLGRNVEVHYRAGDICLPAAGRLVADSGRSIFLEQHYEQRGQRKNFRWEVPYQCIVRVEEKPLAQPFTASPESTVPAPASEAPAQPPPQSAPEIPQASAAHASGGGGTLRPLSNRPKTA